jgi:BMFP domain-containing protein YqiC
MNVPRSAEEAKELLTSIRDRVDDIEQRYDIIEQRLDASSKWLDKNEDRIAELEDENDELRARLEALEARMQIVEGNTDTQEGKVRALVMCADDDRPADQKRVALKVGVLKNNPLLDFSRQTFYDLADSLPDKYPWIENRKTASQYGSLELDHDKQQRAIIIDFEELYKDKEAVKRFTTPREGEVN